MICVAVIHGCGIGYKYYAKYTDCQRKNEILQCLLNNKLITRVLEERKVWADLIGLGRAFHELVTRLK